MRSADDNLVPSDKDLEHLLRKAQKSAAKKEAYKKNDQAVLQLSRQRDREGGIRGFLR